MPQVGCAGHGVHALLRDQLCSPHKSPCLDEDPLQNISHTDLSHIFKELLFDGPKNVLVRGRSLTIDLSDRCFSKFGILLLLCRNTNDQERHCVRGKSVSMMKRTTVGIHFLFTGRNTSAECGLSCALCCGREPGSREVAQQL